MPSLPRLTGLFILLLAPGLVSAADKIPAAEKPIRFNRDIRPILSEHCFTCHGPDAKQREADLRLDVRSSALESSIVPGNVEESEFFQRIISDDADVRMPPAEASNHPLSKQQISLLRRWITTGAEYESHWAFVSPKRPALPVARNASWSKNAIDRFVLAKLEQKGIAPSSRADRATLIRRLTLDLTGLPPTPEETRTFLRDASPGAYEKVVDRLLRSSRYGEHLARFWLDAARYADTNGYQYDLEREQWVWRDWVIHAFNANMPFDQFTVEQLAGDLLPNATDQQRLATAFHRNHPITIEGGVIDEEYRTEYVIDRVVTTSTVWLGMTFVCGRCHDHKYDPLSQNEFYQFFAFFNQTPDKGFQGFAPKLKIASPLEEDRLGALDARIAAAKRQRQPLLAQLKTSLADWETRFQSERQNDWTVVTPIKMTSTGGADLQIQDDRSILAGGKNPTTDTYELVFSLESANIGAIRLEALADASLVNGSTGRGTNGNFVLSEFEAAVASAEQPGEFETMKIATAEADYSQKNYSIAAAIDGQAGRAGWAVDGNTKSDSRQAVFHLAKPINRKSAMLVRIKMLHQYGLNHQIGRFRFSFGPPNAAPLEILAIADTPAGKRTAPQKERFGEYLAVRFGTPELQQAMRTANRLQEQRRALLANIPATMVLTEQSTPRKSYVLLRGEYDKKREEVSPGTPAALPPMPPGAPRNRLGLAQWLVAPNHPLTSRVTVNRFWQRFFGVGLVKTTEDFGSQGAPPSHPDLLDWLAVEFIESGWNVKALQKLIVMSAAYQQSSSVTRESFANDPENRLLARGPSGRLDAEQIRDSALLAGGLLQEQLGGPSVFPYHPQGLWQEINNRPGLSRVYKQDTGAGLYRRSLYTFWKRTVPPPSMATFDAPEREFCVVRRSRTNTPLQALVLLHDPQFVEAARGLAARMIKEGGDSLAGRIDQGFLICFSRRPTESEQDVLIKMYHARLQRYRADPASAKQLLSVGDSPQDSTIDLAEHAAFTTLARILLNLSEFITKG